MRVFDLDSTFITEEDDRITSPLNKGEAQFTCHLTLSTPRPFMLFP